MSRLNLLILQLLVAVRRLALRLHDRLLLLAFDDRQAALCHFKST